MFLARWNGMECLIYDSLMSWLFNCFNPFVMLSKTQEIIFEHSITEMTSGKFLKGWHFESRDITRLYSVYWQHSKCSLIHWIEILAAWGAPYCWNQNLVMCYFIEVLRFLEWASDQLLIPETCTELLSLVHPVYSTFQFIE